MELGAGCVSSYGVCTRWRMFALAYDYNNWYLNVFIEAYMCNRHGVGGGDGAQENDESLWISSHFLSNNK